MLRIAITGGMGSGKSTLCHMLKEEGIPVFSCDSEARRLMATDESLRQQITELVGSLERDDLRSFLGAGPGQADRLNRLVWPRVAEEWTAFCQHHFALGTPVALMECALLFESGFQDQADVSILVTAPADLRLQRVTARDGITPDRARSIMALQMPEEEKMQRADHTLYNIHTREELLQAFHALQL